MKHHLTSLLLIWLLLLTMTACSAANAVQTLDAAEEKVEEKLDAVEDSMERTVQKAITPATAPAQAPAQLTREEAEKIALDYVGVAADQVQRLHTEFEIDDGMPQYDVEFLQGDWEYEFEIHAESGKILSFDKDHKYD